MNIKLDRADTVMSQYIRLRDGECQRCGSKVKINAKGLPISHTVSHYFGRGRENTRFDVENLDCLCMGCHRIWGSDDKEGYRSFKMKQLGPEGFAGLTIRAEQYKKRDRGWELIRAQTLLKTLKP